ncbi:MAG: S-methyl-5-thioribose-1-phosphate isomerase [Deltaproteobacteria bacterium RBG_16_64_85]|nr:MAG: S-methyl-5-thioribose-1-phosphate isomerase [Deltaproteobacteria bacterium RBG_16_64_85]
MPFRTLEWTRDALLLLDQRILPEKESVLRYTDAAGVADAIRTMVVRGAPAIGVAAAFGLVLSVRADDRANRPWREAFREAAEMLGATRPTAVNLFWAIERMRRAASALPDDPREARCRLEREAVAICEEDVEANRRMGAHGAKLFFSGTSVLTHCNAGALATAGYGTALGVIRAAVAAGKRIHVYVDETRPFLQGARLTAWELMKDRIPCTLITDNMAAKLMGDGKIQAAIVGADRIARNGDVANKIGTYGVAVLCRVHKIPFYVAAPCSTIDPAIRTGKEIPIEERDGREVTHLMGRRVAPEGVTVCNPAFDVTPARYVSAIATEKGVLRPPLFRAIRELFR